MSAGRSTASSIWLRKATENDDYISGDLGNDVVTGDKGNGTLVGGGGADVFYVSTDTNVDRVIDFNRTEGDAVHALQGGYTTYQSGSDVIVDYGNGSQLILVGVQLTTLGAGWIY